MLGIINHLNDLFESHQHHNEAEIDSVIKELSDYAIYHFQTEKKYFDLYGYEKADEHLKIHDQNRQKIDEWRTRYDADKDPKIFFEISEFLQNWWTWHINNTDRAYVPFLKTKGL